MRIIKAKNIGFCNGVSYTIKKANELLEIEQDKLYCLGEIVHNENVIKNLESKGLIFINDIKDAPDNATIIFRAHGEPIETYEKAKNKNLNIIDLTCGKVRVIHNKVKTNSLSNFIILIGKKTHPEIVATKSFAGNNSFVINDLDDIDKAYDTYKKQDKKSIYLCSQTTYSTKKYNELLNAIYKIFNGIDIKVENTICSSTTNRQNEVIKISKEANKVLVIGDKHSSNTKELYNMALINCSDVYFIQEESDLSSINFSSNDIVGIVSGASTPIEIVDDIVKKLSLNMQ